MFSTFHKPSTRLAGLYLAILMAISLFFSGFIYQLSVQELERGLRRPEPIFQQRQFMTTIPSDLRTLLNDQRQQRFDEAQDRILIRLAAINMLILIGGGFLSYYLALRTLRPIEEAHEAQSRFTADASHELRTPITAMRSENEVALMNPKLSLKEAKEQLQSNIEELEKLSVLSEGLLRLAQLEHKKSLPMQDISIASIMDMAVSRVMQNAEHKNILIKTKINDDTQVSGDQTSLVESLVILLDNAIKYSPKKSEVSLSVDKKQKYTVVSVSDTGPGMSPEELPHIFERFYRADSSRTKQNVSGYGLGLAIAKNIIEIHDGTIQAESTIGKGSTFTVRLPIKN